MSDSESISSDGSNDAIFQNDFIESIPDDSDSSESENDAAFKHIKLWAHQQGFFVRKGRPEKVQSRRRKQTIVCRCEGVYNQINHQKSHRTNYKWHVNLSWPIKNNLNDMIFITTLFNEHFGHNLDTSASYFEASKAFTKPMLNDIEWTYPRKLVRFACKSCDESFIALLEEYINKKNREALNLEQSRSSQIVEWDDHQITNGLEIDQENVGQIGNPIIRRPKRNSKN
ncbi:hypothetical protein RhiirC2_780412 [Rhizophagus irregularis]|uniref:FAR1 domain-containing protein n=1 Tax=Rhizophagus irregularis TaxID=588596 RepID=A0A2N1N7W4_9GLOM|nr:hypothetical protein RhiirC2_780412 [Rhizophagus irregularis]